MRCELIEANNEETRKELVLRKYEKEQAIKEKDEAKENIIKLGKKLEKETKDKEDVLTDCAHISTSGPRYQRSLLSGSEPFDL